LEKSYTTQNKAKSMAHATYSFLFIFVIWIDGVCNLVWIL